MTTRLPDSLIEALDAGLRTVFAPARAQRHWRSLQQTNPSAALNTDNTTAPAAALSEAERRHAAGLMRVNHVGEVCAQALYTAQALSTRDAALAAHFQAASAEETDHLAWTEQRLRELDSRTSLLNPLWYAGAFAIGTVAARLGDKWSLGFVVETERQVEAHLDSHLDALPAGDHASRAIVMQMKADEAAHAQAAQARGAAALPEPVKALMRSAAKVMTTVAYRL
jgi:ubiquinone biosynthesis monooxygenase Coq7